jgi:hypothetical protein
MVGAIWLFFLGKWKTVVLGLIASALVDRLNGGLFSFGQTISLKGLSMGDSAQSEGSNRILGQSFWILGAAWTAVSHTVWGVGVLWAFSWLIALGEGNSVVPYLLFSIGLASYPIARIENVTKPSNWHLATAQNCVWVGYPCSAVLYWYGLDFSICAVTFASFMLLAFILILANSDAEG